MARAALSALRGLEIIDFLAMFPTREFTMSEIMRATDINVASCHSILNVLIERGYLARDSKQKTYRLGPVPVAIGEAAEKATTIIGRSKRIARDLSAELNVPVLLSAAISDEIVGIVSVNDPSGRAPGLKVGERRPLIPPLGASFLAWEAPEAIEEWLAALSLQQSPEFSEEQRHNLALIRQRGYHVGLKRRQTHRLAREIEDMAAARSPKALKFELAGMIRDIAHIPLPETVDPNATHEILLIAAPIFDPNGACVYNLCLGEYSTALNLGQIEHDGNRLLRACIEIMQTHTQ